MGRWDFSDWESMINNSLNNTFNVIDNIVIKTEEVKDNILNTTNSVKNNIKNNTKDLNDKIEKMKKEQYSRKYCDNESKKVNKSYTMNFKDKSKDDKIRNYIVKGAPGSISGIFFIILGSVLTAVFGISVISYAVLTSFKAVFSLFNIVSLGTLFMLLGISIGIIFKGTGLRKKAKRFKTYVNCLKGREYCEIEEFARSIGKKKKFVIKDLKKMIDAGMFKEANMDDKQTYFMLGNDVYENYIMAEQSFEKRKADEAKRKEEYEEASSDPSKTQLMETIDLCRGYINDIKEANESIYDEAFSEKLDRMQRIVTEILNCIEKNPGKLNDVNKFTNHYLPITLKLVTSYRDLSRQEVQGENIRTAKNEIESSIDLINKAFEKLLDDLFEDVALDVSTDISVLKTLFTQDGLTKRDFKKEDR